ncbi:MAG: hypothetical protein ACP5PZ_03830 [Bacteroidales bacterium]
MQDSDNGIDRLFRDKLAQHEEEAPPQLWNKIVEHLELKRRKQFVRIYVSLAASMALIVSMGIGYYLGLQRASRQVADQQILKDYKVVHLPHKNKGESLRVYTATTEKRYANSHAVREVNETNEDKYANTPLSAVSSYTALESTMVLNKNSSYPEPVANRQGLCQLTNTKYPALPVNDLPKQQVDKRNIFDKFYLSFTAAPLYSYRVVNGVQSATLDNFEKPAVTFSAGMNAIAAKNRLQLSVGLYFTQMALRIHHVLVSRNPLTSYDTYAIEKGTGSVTLLNSSGNILADTPEWALSNSESFVALRYSSHFIPNSNDKGLADSDNMTYGNNPLPLTYLTQKFNYLEFPLNIQYNLYQQRITVGIQAGINANLLISNATFAKVDGTQTRVGQTTGIRTFNIATTLGGSVSIPLAGRLSFLIEPRIRYYVFSVNRSNAIDTHPYSYGIYTGILFRY